VGKRSSSTATAAGTSKKAKKIAAAVQDYDSPTVEQWDYSKFVEKDLRKAAKEDILKDDAGEIPVPGPEATPTPLAGFRVMFLAFVLRGLFFLCMTFSEVFSFPTGFSCMI
jgi:hypothetical protein